MIDEKKLIEAINCKMGEIKSDKEKCEVISGFADIVLEIYDGILYFVKDQPKVGSWIPCSERLPEMHREDMESEGEYYMISDPVLATDGDNMYVAEYEIDDGCRAGWVDCVGEDCEDIIAWQPLPEPYRPGGVNHEE